MAVSQDVTIEHNMSPQLVKDTVHPSFICLLEVVSEIYQVLPKNFYLHIMMSIGGQNWIVKLLFRRDNDLNAFVISVPSPS